MGHTVGMRHDARAIAPIIALGLAAAWSPANAAAQDAGMAETAALAAAPGSATEATPPEPVTPEPAPAPAPEPPWSLSASAGIGARDDGPDGTWRAIALTRTVGRGYLRAGLMRYHGTLLQADVALPSDYTIATLGAGGNFNNWVVDGWASYGRQDYGKISTSAGSRPSNGSRHSDYWALGGDFGRIFALGGNWYLTSTVTGSFASGKLLRPAPTGSGLPDLETAEPTWSANASLRIDHAFGPAQSHYAGLSISRNWTSNGISALQLASIGSGSGVGDLPDHLDSKHYADGWFEAGATASMKLADRIHLDMFGSRSFGVTASNVTTAGVSLRKAF